METLDIGAIGDQSTIFENLIQNLEIFNLYELLIYQEMKSKK